MKDLFSNSVGFNTCCIEVSSHTQIIKLHYHLHDNPVQHLWQEAHGALGKLKTNLSSGLTTDEILNLLNIHCKAVNIPTYTNNITQEDLNRLHHQFVLSEKNQHWLQINHLIHLFEDKINSSVFSSLDYSFSFYNDNKINFDIKEEYKLFLGSDAIWGGLTLGYNTLGKDWITIPKNNDNDTDLAIQSKINSETYLSFSAEEPFPMYREQKFYQWAKMSNDINVPLNNLNSLSYGRYTLGFLIITDDFLNFHDNASDWYVPNHRCKFEWNRSMLGANVTVNNISFFNSDLFYSQLIKHSKLDSIINV